MMRVLISCAILFGMASRFALVSVLLAAPACSIMKAAKQPGLKDLSVLKRGAARNQVISELGPPAFSEQKDGTLVELYIFKQGYHTGIKVSRAVFHAGADVFTFGLWEIFANPIEEMATGTEMSVEVTFNENDEVEKVVVYKGESKFSDEDFEEDGITVATIPASSSSANGDLRLQLGERVQDLATQLSREIDKRGITRIAVLTVTDASHDKNRPLGNYLTDKLTISLYNTGSTTVVERSQLDRVIDELALTMTGRFDDASIKQIGHLLGVDAVIISTYAEIGVRDVEVNSRIVDVETGAVLGVGSIHVSRRAVRQLL